MKNHKNIWLNSFNLTLVDREYSAIVYGHMIAGGTVDEPIGRDPKDRVKQAVSTSGKRSDNSL